MKRPTRAKQHKFLATIQKIGINRCVAVPEEISRSLGRRGYIPVLVVVGGRSARATLVPSGGGRHRLFLDQHLRKAVRADAGDLVGVLLELDAGSRELPAPPELRAALKKSGRAQKAFEKITPGLRREFLRWVLAAKTPETRLRRIRRGLKVLIERAA
jgi:hypothetical protein